MTYEYNMVPGGLGAVRRRVAQAARRPVMSRVVENTGQLVVTNPFHYTVTVFIQKSGVGREAEHLISPGGVKISGNRSKTFTLPPGQVKITYKPSVARLADVRALQTVSVTLAGG